MVVGLRVSIPLEFLGKATAPYPLTCLSFIWRGSIINQEVATGRWKLLQITKRRLVLSHLFFADDALLFMKIDISQARVVANVLAYFLSLSSMKVSLQNLELWPPRDFLKS